MNKIVKIIKGKRYIINVPSYDDYSSGVGGDLSAYTSSTSPSSSGETVNYGESFEGYSLGTITSFNQPSLMFSENGTVTPSYYGLISYDNFSLYNSGSGVSLGLGMNWSTTGSIS